MRDSMPSRRQRTLVLATAVIFLAAVAGCDHTVGDDDSYDPHASTGRDAGTSAAPDASATSVDAGRGGTGDGGGSRDGGGGGSVDGGATRDGAAADAAAAAAAAFGAICTVNANCQSNLCFAFGQGGSACTFACTPANAAAVCPPVNGVNLGCNGMGVCKVR